jgi:type I restriction enzyme M protein
LTRTSRRESSRAFAGDIDRDKVSGVLAEFGLDSKPMLTAVLDALALRDEEAPVVTDAKGHPLPDAELRDQENIPLPERGVTFEPDVTGRLAFTDYRAAVDDYVKAEVRPFVDDCWVDYTKTRLGYEIPLTRHFYKYLPPRPLEEIDAEIKALEAEIQKLISEVTE